MPSIRTGHKIMSGLSCVCLSATSFSASASAGSANSSTLAWSVLISVLVVAVSAGSAVLPVSAIRHWSGGWQKSAYLPLLMLLVWGLTLILSASSEGLEGRLWALELFVWAMFTTVYMVSAMTIKRIFEKKDHEGSLSD